MPRIEFAFLDGYIGACGMLCLCFAQPDNNHRKSACVLFSLVVCIASPERSFASVPAFRLSIGGVHMHVHRSFSSRFRWIRLIEDAVLKRAVKGWMTVAFESSCRSEPEGDSQ